MPHLLIAGTTGSGKSVAINTMILSLVYRLRPDQCRLIMVDPKMLELSVYDGIPHLLTPVVTDPKKAVVALKWAVREMEERYKKMSKLGVRNIEGYNARLAEARANGEKLTRTVHTGYDKESGRWRARRRELRLDRRHPGASRGDGGSGSPNVGDHRLCRGWKARRTERNRTTARSPPCTGAPERGRDPNGSDTWIAKRTRP